MTNFKSAISNDYEVVLDSPDGDRFFNAIVTNSPRVWTSRAYNGSYCEEMHMNLSVSFGQTSCRFISYKSWVKLVNVLDGDTVEPDPAMADLVFDTKLIKQYPIYVQHKEDSEPLRSPCDDINCNCATHYYHHSPNQVHTAPGRSRLKATLIGLGVAVVLILVITVPIVATRHDSQADDSQWTNTKY